MDIPQLRSALVAHFASEEFTEVKDADQALDLVLAKGNLRWGLALCPEREEGMEFLGSFEAAMQKMVDAHQSGDKKLKLGLGLAFGSTADGKHPSYRRALKKYSNSIVFEDLGLHLFLVLEAGEVMDLEPSKINHFLRDLDKWIAANKSKSKIL